MQIEPCLFPHCEVRPQIMLLRREQQCRMVLIGQPLAHQRKTEVRPRRGQELLRHVGDDFIGQFAELPGTAVVTGHEQVLPATKSHEELRLWYPPQARFSTTISSASAVAG